MRNSPQGVSAIQHPPDQRYREPDHIEIAAVNSLDELRSQTLNRVRAGFVHRLTGSDIFLDIGRRQFSEPDLRFSICACDAEIRNKADASYDGVLTPAQDPQHARGVGR